MTAVTTAWRSAELRHRIANPTVLDRIPTEDLRSLMAGYGPNAYIFEVTEGDDIADAHQRFAMLLDTVLNEISEIKARAAGYVRAYAVRRAVRQSE